MYFYNMKKLLYTLLAVSIIFSACKKDENEPNTNSNNTTTTGNTDTITNNTDSVTILSPSQTFPLSFATALGEGYNVTSAEFEINCSEQTTLPADISYSFVSTNYLSPVQSEKQYGNGFISFYDHYESPSIEGGPGILGRFATTTYPKNSNHWPAHTVTGGEEMMLNFILSYNYTPGILTLDLASYACGGDVAYWTVDLVVTEYSDGTIELSIDQGPNTTMDGQITWDSHLKITLQKNF